MPCCPPPESLSGPPLAAARWQVRAQPWLGTLVEVALPPADASEARFAAAFAAIAHVHRRMSAHDPRSDLARIARHAHRQPVRVDRQTVAVLRLALHLSGVTGGRFDVAVPGGRPHRPRAVAPALRLEPGRRVRTSAKLALDLGGIAKGHAVDLAIDALRRSGAEAGLVNAGGDLRAFGAGHWTPVRVRLPGSATVAPPLFELRDAAAATSSDDFRDGHALFDSRRQRLRPFTGSVTVVAPTCALADGLTKVVALMPAQAPRLLARHRAHAFRMTPGAHSCSTTWREASNSLRLVERAGS
jgi:FAD:protein FMN transferase